MTELPGECGYVFLIIRNYVCRVHGINLGTYITLILINDILLERHCSAFITYECVWFVRLIV